MNKKEGVNRRDFIKSVSLCALFMVCSNAKSSVFIHNSNCDTKLLLDSYLRMLFTSFSYAKNIGKKYLELQPSDTKKEFIVETLLENKIFSDIDSLKIFIDAKRKIDFASENIVFINGWPYSLTEAQLCALACFI